MLILKDLIWFDSNMASELDNVAAQFEPLSVHANPEICRAALSQVCGLSNLSP